MPERKYQRALVDGGLGALFVGDAYSQGGADQADEGVSGGDDDGQGDSLEESEAAGTGGDFGCGRGSGRADFGHDNIVEVDARECANEGPAGVERSVRLCVRFVAGCWA